MECNPFHEGHAYVIQKARDITGAQYCVVVMSGAFVQRGEPAVLPKETRARRILEAGADLVLELPVCYATGAADYFARGGVTLLQKLGIVTDLVFGSECANSEKLLDAARFLLAEPPAFSSLLRKNMAAGMTYATARSRAADALGTWLPNTPNDVLGVEYCKYTFKSERHLQVHALPRTDAPHASELRKSMHDVRSEFDSALCYALFQSRNSLNEYLGVSDDLANRIRQFLPQYQGYASFCSLIKTRNITYTAVSRALLHILLQIRKDAVQNCLDAGTIGYARVLGFRRESASFLKLITDVSDIPLITKLSDAPDTLASPFAEMLQQDIAASELYDIITNLAKKSPEQRTVPELSKRLIVI